MQKLLEKKNKMDQIASQKLLKGEKQSKSELEKPKRIFNQEIHRDLRDSKNFFTFTFYHFT